MSGRPLTLGRSIAIGEEEGLVGVEQWAEIRRMHRVDGLSGREISRRTGLARDTVARLLAASEPPKYERRPVGSKLDPFKGLRLAALTETVASVLAGVWSELDSERRAGSLYVPRRRDAERYGLPPVYTASY